jgi:hypothetical protein
MAIVLLFNSFPVFTSTIVTLVIIQSCFPGWQKDINGIVSTKITKPDLILLEMFAFMASFF